MGANDDNLLRTSPAGNLHFQIVAGLATYLEAEPADLEACLNERGRDPRGRFDQARIHEPVAVPDFACNHLNVTPERVAQRGLLGTQRDPRSAIAFEWHAKHKAPAAEAD